MEERIMQFAGIVREKNKKERYVTIVSYVVLLLEIFLYLFWIDSKFSMDGTQNHLLFFNIVGVFVWIVLLIGFEIDFFRRYLQISYKENIPVKKIELKLDMETEILELMKIHNIPFNGYFDYIKKQLIPYQIGMLAVALVSSLLSKYKIICFGISVFCFLLSFVFEWLYQKYCKAKLTSRKKFLIVLIFDGVYMVVFGMVKYAVTVVSCFFFFLVVATIGDLQVTQEQVYVRGIGAPWLAHMYFFSALILGGLLVFEYNRAKWFVWIQRFLIMCVTVSLLLCVLSNRFWYTEINYTTQKIRVVHITQKEYDFSEIKEYEWVKEDEQEDAESILVITLPDGTKCDLYNGCVFSVDYGEYEKAEKEFWK